MRSLSKWRNSVAKRMFWRSHLADAREQMQLYKRELVTPEMLMTVPMVFRGKGFYHSLDLKQNMQELRGLCEQLSKLELNNVCEIGTYKGGTLFIWCQLAGEAANVFSIDLPGGAFGGGYSERSLPLFDAFRKQKQRLECLRGDSHASGIRERFARMLGGEKLDFLFIDGDHSYEGVKQDFEDYSPFVRPGGIIAFHDIVHREQQPDIEVWRFWEELKGRYRHKEFVERGADRRAIGIGMVVQE